MARTTARRAHAASVSRLLGQHGMEASRFIRGRIAGWYTEGFKAAQDKDTVSITWMVNSYTDNSYDSQVEGLRRMREILAPHFEVTEDATGYFPRLVVRSKSN